ncbi:MAG: aminotransferase class V-fold PLP-dependent enzyme [Pseudomonadota bacterium]
MADLPAGANTDTLLAQALGWLEPMSGGVVPAIEPATTYKRDPAMPVDEGLWYSRPDNPCYWQVEALIARLEGAEAALVTGSGSASMAMVAEALTVGDHVLIPKMAYGGLHFLATDMANHWGIRFDSYPAGDLDALKTLMRPGETKIVWVEAPSNPELIVTDIAAASAIAHDAGARLVVDSTFAPPPLFRPIDLGADLVLHSATKFLNGHSDVVAGSIATARCDDFWDHIAHMRFRSGAVLGPFETWLMLRGMRTLHVRMERAQQNAQAVAAFLAQHDRVSRVYYPGLPEHPSHDLARRQMAGFGAMIAFDVDGGADEAAAVWGGTKVFKNATSLGGPESLIEHRHVSDGYDTPVPPSLLRLSIGLEDQDDLIADLDQALGGPASNRKPGTATNLAQGLGWESKPHGGVILPLYMAATYQRAPDAYGEGYSYGRDHNPNFEQPEALLAELEGGAAARIFSSGMAATAAVFQALSHGDHVVVQDTLYWGVRAFLKQLAVKWGIAIDWFPSGDLDALRAMVRDGETKVVWIETPANPEMTIIDIAGAAAIAHDVGARLVADNTFATPLVTRPLDLDADMVMHSATKYLNGHSDVVAGALVTARDDDFWQEVAAVRHLAGAILGPFEAWLLMRGMRTLDVRLERAMANAMAVAEHLENHGAVSQVLYPGLASFAGHDMARGQMAGGFGAMLSIRVGGGEDAAKRVWSGFRVFKTATSLGGVESLVEHRGSVEGADSPVPKDLLRLSVGIEHIDDLIADLDRALTHA